MPSRVLPGLGLNGFWEMGEPWKTGGDSNWLKLSVVTQLAVESATANLPSNPQNGVIYIVPQSDATNKGKVAVRDSGSWVYFTPQVGWAAWVKDVSKRLRLNAGGDWVDEAPQNNGGAPVQNVSGQNRQVLPTDSGSYMRFTSVGTKSASFDSASSFTTGQEFHIANRAPDGALSISATGVTLNPPKGGTLRLDPGDTVTVKFITTTTADVFGSTEAAV